MLKYAYIYRETCKIKKLVKDILKSFNNQVGQTYSREILLKLHALELYIRFAYKQISYSMPLEFVDYLKPGNTGKVNKKHSR